eukprot:6215581-Prymnesium_polylepis.1
MRSPTTAPPTRFSPRRRPDGSTCATFCAARWTQAPEYSSNQRASPSGFSTAPRSACLSS